MNLFRGNTFQVGHSHLMSLALGAALIGAQPSIAQAQAQAQIGISYQPAQYFALPFHFATEKGWWKDVGLVPNFSTFPAGAPQMAASAARSWDVAGTGSLPAVLGAVRFNILTIGLTNDESRVTGMMVRGEKFEEIKKDPKLLKGQKLLLTTNSTADYAARKCLRKFGLSHNDMQFINLAPAQVITSLSSKNGDTASVWAPANYILEERADAKYLCTGADAGATVAGALVVRAEFAKERPDDVAKVLAVFLRGWSWAKANPEEARTLAHQFYKNGGLEISDRAMRQEFAWRPTFGLDEHLKLMARTNGPSVMDGWFSDIGQLIADVGTIPSNPPTQSYITDEFMKRVAADPKLRAFATEFDKK